MLWKSNLRLLLIDLLIVLALALGGRSAHDENAAIWIVLVIAWPFAVGALVAHAALLWQHRPASPIWPGGVLVLLSTYVLGMVLRVLTGRGTAPGFLIVAAVFLTATMLGARLAIRVVGRMAQRLNA